MHLLKISPIMDRVCPASVSYLAAWAVMAALWLPRAASGSQGLAFTNINLSSDGSFQAQIQTLAGQSYSVETSTNLADWSAIASFDSVTTNLITLVNPPRVDKPGQLFYRARLGTALVYTFSFVESAYGGSYGSGWIPYPVRPNAYAASFAVDNDTNYPPATNVFFTGPPGSGITNAPASSSNSTIGTNGAIYQSSYPASPAIAPGGILTVEYNGTNHTFNVPDPQAASRLVIPLPTAVSEVPNGECTLEWEYKDAATTTNLGGPPVFMTAIQADWTPFVSPTFPPATTTWQFSAAGYAFPREGYITMTYKDSFGNTYAMGFSQLSP